MVASADALTPPAARALADAVPTLVCLCRDELIVHLNPAGGILLGIDPVEAQGRCFADFLAEPCRSAMATGLASLLEAPGAVPVCLIGADGLPRDISLTAHVIDPGTLSGTAPLIALSGIDSRAVGRAARDLAEQQARGRRIVEAVLDPTFLLDGAGRVVFLNAAARRLLDVDSPGEVSGLTLADLLHPDYQDVVDLGPAALAAEGEALPLKLLRMDRSAVDVEAMVVPFVGPDSFLLEARDITGRVRAAEGLRQREARLRGILDTMGEAVVTVGEDGLVASFNPAAENMFGYSAREMVGHSLHALMPSEVAANHDRYMARFLLGRPSQAMGHHRELEGRRKDGSLFPMEITVTVLRVGARLLFTGILRDITERKRAERAERAHRVELERRVEERTRELAALGQRNQSILETVGDGILGLDPEGRVVFANPAVACILGGSVDHMVGLPVGDVLRAARPGSGGGCPAEIRAAMADGRAHGPLEVDLLRSNNTAFPAELASQPILAEAGLGGTVIVLRDITERRQVAERLRIAGIVFDSTSEGVLVADGAGLVRQVNPAFSGLTGLAPGDVLGQPFLHLLAHDARTAAALTTALTRSGHYEWEEWRRRPGTGEAGDDGRVALRVAVNEVRDGAGQTTHYAVVIGDITRRKLDQERIQYQASYDSLTGLPNRRLFMDRLDQAVAQAARRGHRMGLMFIDLDGFKEINDSLGHQAGDALLVAAARRMGHCVREADTLARLGGDEFTVILSDVADEAACRGLAERLIEALSRPFDLGERQGHISASIGSALLPDQAANGEELLRRADAAMYHAKARGKANHQPYRPGMGRTPES
ncbi:PAS domain S-box protein [Roseospirillum parvum]|nr:PAS domain S-box protein [Roseospirillum parvum]